MIQAMILLLKDRETIPGAFTEDYSTCRNEVLELEHLKSHVLSIPTQKFLELETVGVKKKPLRIFLKDGDRIDLHVQNLDQIMSELDTLKNDIEHGYELLLPDVFVFDGSRGRNIEQFEGKPIPDNMHIAFRDSKEPVPEDEEAAWRAGRNPQREQVEAAKLMKSK